MAEKTCEYRYRVNHADELVAVDPWWLAFAQENSATELKEDFVLGRSLWQFISGEDTYRFYQDLHARIRETGEPVSLPFRCDSPTLQRHMQMIIRPSERREIEYSCRLVKVVPQREIQLLSGVHPPSEDSLALCSCCKRGLVESEGWVGLEVISERLRSIGSLSSPRTRHVVCSECRDAAQLA